MSETDPPPSTPDVDLNAYLKRRLLSGLVALVLLLAAVVVAGIHYESEIQAAAEWTVATLGVPGIIAITTFGDMIVTPFPPDVFLVVIAESSLREYWYLVVLGMGLGSSMAGNTGWWLGKKLGMTRVPQLFLARMRPEDRALVSRYGSLGVAIGALTPVPFSLTCWMAGMLKLPFSSVWTMTLLRIPRFALYYVFVHYSTSLAAWW